MSGSSELNLAKPSLDVCLFTNDARSLRDFWTAEVGLVAQTPLAIREGLLQHRFLCGDAVIKVNEQAAPLPDVPPSGYRELLIARAGIATPHVMSDPQGSRVTLVPPGFLADGEIGMRVHVRDIVRTCRFFREALRLPIIAAENGVAVRIGRSRLLLFEDRSVVQDLPVEAPGWRFLTLQIFDARELYRQVIESGGREGRPPRTLGDIARFALVRDPDGNWIELVQRASLAGPIAPDDEASTVKLQE